VIIGVAGSLALTRVIAQQLYGVKTKDPLTYSMVIVVLISSALIASLIPARRAARIQPMDALRHE